MRFGTEVTAATFADDEGWTVTLADGTEEVFDVVVAATGQLNRPYVPPIEGLDDLRRPGVPLRPLGPRPST